ncbi:DNA-binding protein [Plantactinospora sp. BC1]|uniref:helix-turn-helix domain-containing protein n=1 Tax=Plantactinospora sp. BC1 TaxID=2108470 RepID=UPI000D167640|nr:helix-turn-helix transcriptional regulator [Plantactinospora sp. BC1]AVT32153.1 DNA-binding protein [Plantactinospora sp. BC1]
MLLDPLRIPDDVWSDHDVRVALVGRDIGALFRLISRLTRASQTRLGAACGLEQGYVSRIMNGRRVTSIEVLERIADGCDMPDESRMAMGLAPRTRPCRPDMAFDKEERKAEDGPRRAWRDSVRSCVDLWRGDVNRRDLLRRSAFTTAGYTLPALRWLTASDPAPLAQRGSRSVGPPEVETIREMTAAYRRLDNQYGGGHARDAVARYLDLEVAPLLIDGRYDHDTGRRLLSATAELSQLAGWQAYDMAEHGIAQRYLTLALDLAGEAGDHNLGAEIIAAMSHQATYLGHAATGIDLARAARETARRTGMRILVAEALVMEAHAHAVGRDKRACVRTLHQAEQALDRADRGSGPEWISYFDEAYLSAKFGHCFHALGQLREGERFAVRSLRMNPSYVRGNSFNLALLASIYAGQGEVDRACTIGTESLAKTKDLRSARAVRYLRDLQSLLAAHRRRPAVRQFVNQVDAVLGKRR